MGSNKKKSAYLIDGLSGIGMSLFVIVALLFLNNAGTVQLTEKGPSFAVMVFFGWPVFFGFALSGLYSWGSGGASTLTVVLPLLSILLNVAYAFGFGALIGYFLRKK